MDAPRDESPIPSSIADGRYQVVGRIGKGGMGEVVEAFDTKLKRAVAIKFLRPDLTAEPRLRRRFEIEATAAARLSHRNVVTIFDVGEDNTRPFIVMELLSPVTLADRIRDERLPLDTSISIGKQLLLAVEVAHGLGIIHRDIKPSNVLFGKDGEVKLSDFGIASIIDEQPGGPDVTLTSEVLGTPSYLAPERARGERPAASSDLFSIGAVIYEMVTGLKPYRGDTAFAIVMSGQSGIFESASGLNPKLSRDWDAFFSRSLDPKVENRFQSAAEMASSLDALSGSTDTTESMPLQGGQWGTYFGATDLTEPLGTPRSIPSGRSPKTGFLNSGRRSKEIAAVLAAVALVLALVAWSALGTGGSTARPSTQSTTITSLTTTTSSTSTSVTTSTTTPIPPGQNGPPGGPPGKGKKK